MTNAWNTPNEVQRSWLTNTLLLHSAVCGCSTPGFHLQDPLRSAWSSPGGAGAGAGPGDPSGGEGLDELLAYVEDENTQKGTTENESNKENEEKKSNGTGTQQR